MRVSEPDHPFYRPLWRRVALCVAVAAWAGYEVFVTADPLWMVLTLGLLAYAVWTFLVTYKPPEDKAPTGSAPAADGDEDPVASGEGDGPSDGVPPAAGR